MEASDKGLPELCIPVGRRAQQDGGVQTRLTTEGVPHLTSGKGSRGFQTLHHKSPQAHHPGRRCLVLGAGSWTHHHPAQKPPPAPPHGACCYGRLTPLLWEPCPGLPLSSQELLATFNLSTWLGWEIPGFHPPPPLPSSHHYDCSRPGRDLHACSTTLTPQTQSAFLFSPCGRPFLPPYGKLLFIFQDPT